MNAGVRRTNKPEVMGMWSNSARVNQLAEKLLHFLIVYERQYKDILSKCDRLENFAASEADARERITRHAERLELRIQDLERLMRTPMSPGNSATPDAAPQPPVDTP